MKQKLVDLKTKNKKMKHRILRLQNELEELKRNVPKRYLAEKCSVCGEVAVSNDAWTCILCDRHYCGHPECNQECCKCV